MINKLKKEILKLSLNHKPIFNQEDHKKYTTDWRGQFHGETLGVLKPCNKIEVSNILKFANKFNLGVIPQGGNTSLCGGATPIKGQNSIILSTEKLDKIRTIDKNSKSLTVESGVILSDIHDYVEK
jgi:FAD/FMN-containing dehydrogenases